MTYPRAHLVDQVNGGYYHCISRCVRQSWLCGLDKRTGKSFEHRRLWIAARVKSLTKYFAVDIYAYAVMSNHYHLVLRLDPKRALRWSDEDVARRWIGRHGGATHNHKAEDQIKNLVGRPDRIRELRKRLGSLSWFMRHVNEPLARAANAEDQCKGRFWEGRFKSVALLDHTALLACMVYVDLNPARANSQVQVPSPHTSAAERQKEAQNLLMSTETLGASTDQYLELLRASKPETREPIDRYSSVIQLFSENAQHAQQIWLRWVGSFSRGYRAYGSKKSLRRYTKELGQSWLRNPRMNSIDKDADFQINLRAPSA